MVRPVQKGQYAGPVLAVFQPVPSVHNDNVFVFEPVIFYGSDQRLPRVPGRVKAPGKPCVLWYTA